MEIGSKATKEKKSKRSGWVRFTKNNSNFAPGVSLISTPTAESDYWSGAAEDVGKFPGVAAVDLPPLPYTVPSSDPFSGFGGHLFLFFCWVTAILTGSIAPRSAPAKTAAESFLGSRAALKRWGACLLGIVCCTVSAAGLMPLFITSSVKSLLPLAFLPIILLVAFIFGRAAGVLGAFVAAFLFADFLFEPAGLSVGDPAARAHLIWMLILGVVISDLLERFRVHRRGGHKF